MNSAQLCSTSTDSTSGELSKASRRGRVHTFCHRTNMLMQYCDWSKACPQKSLPYIPPLVEHTAVRLCPSVSQNLLRFQSSHWTECNTTPLLPTKSNPSPPHLLLPTNTKKASGGTFPGIYTGVAKIKSPSCPMATEFYNYIRVCVCVCARTCACVYCVYVNQRDWGAKSDESPVLKAFRL